MQLKRRPLVVTSLPPRRRRAVLIAVVAGGALLVAGGSVGATAIALTHPAQPGADAAAAAAVTPLHVDTAGFPKGDVGIFTDTCTRVETAPNDPILMPGMTGKSMQHDFFGNTGTTASSTTAQLVGGTSSCSTAADSSAYWTPVLYQDGRALAPKSTLIYWRAPKSTSRSVKTIPAGLTMIAGDETSRVPQSLGTVAWRCSGVQTGRGTDTPHDCAQGSQLRLVITFPDCWDGRTLDGRTQANVVYPQNRNAACPASHPVQIPQIVFHANYPTSSAAQLTVSIGPDAQGTVNTEHADFMNGWNERVLSADVAACTAAQTRCGPVHGATAVPKGGRTRQQRESRRAGGGTAARLHRAHAGGRTTTSS